VALNCGTPQISAGSCKSLKLLTRHYSAEALIGEYAVQCHSLIKRFGTLPPCRKPSQKAVALNCGTPQISAGACVRVELLMLCYATEALIGDYAVQCHGIILDAM